MLKTTAVAVLASSLLSAADAGAAPLQFDLLCDGVHGIHLQFRFDLAQKKWCVGSCESVWAVDEIRDSAIKVGTISSDSRYNWTFVFDRYKSTFAAVHRGYGDDPADAGECKPLPFSGFPTRKF